MESTSATSIRGHQVALGFAITFTALAIIAAAATAIAFFILSAPPIAIVGGIAATIIFTGSAIALYVKSYLMRSSEASIAPSIQPRAIQKMPISTSSSRPPEPPSYPDTSNTALHSPSSINTANPKRDTTEAQKRTEILSLIPTPVKNVLHSLFEGSPYSIDQLPVCGPIDQFQDFRKTFRTNMTSSVMLGKRNGTNTTFIAIRVECHLSEENIKRIADCEHQQEKLRKNPILKSVLVIGQYNPSGPYFYGGQQEHVWDQLNRPDSLAPQFFPGNFTCPRSGMFIESHQENFKRAQQLLQTGSGADRNGLIWEIK
jgi:hypothetical protein